MGLVTLALLVGGGLVAGGVAVKLRGARRRRAARAGAGAAAARSTGSAGARPEEDSQDPERSLDQVRSGDVVILEDRDYQVAGLLRLQDGGRRWTECLLEDGELLTWLVIPEEPEPFLLVGRPAPDLVQGASPSELLDFQGAAYRLFRRGQAASRREGDPGPATGGDQAAFWDYQAPGPGRIWLRRFDGSMLTFAGRQVPRHMVTLLPGS